MKIAMMMDAKGSAHSQPEERHRGGCEHGTDAAERIGQHVQPCAAQIQVRMAAVGEQPQPEQVHRQAAARHEQHQLTLHLGRLADSLQRFEEDEQGDDEERGAVEKRRQYLGALIAERAAAACRPTRRPEREERKTERRGIGQHVAGIGEQRQGVRGPCPDDFGDHVAASQREGPTASGAHDGGFRGR
jgi:hypothetical protein